MKGGFCMENIRKDKGYVHNMGRADPVLYPRGCSCNILQKEVVFGHKNNRPKPRKLSGYFYN